MTAEREDIIVHSQAQDIENPDQPEWLQRRLEWFKELQFGLFINWGPYCQWDCCESWPLVPEDTWARPRSMKCWTERGRDLNRFTRDYVNLNRTFNPVKFDPNRWAELAAGAGMRYVNFTVKHHDGFCMFDTATTDYRVTHHSCPFHDHPRANIAREVFDAFRKQGMAISCYFSKSDWHSPYYWSPDRRVVDRNPNYDPVTEPARWDRFVEFVHQQIQELMTQYGRIDILWLDGGQVRPPDQDIRMPELAAMARAFKPGLIIVDRTVGGPYENFVTPEQVIPEKSLDVPWESCVSLGNSWKFVTNDCYKSVSEIVRMKEDVLSKGGNLLLGVGPDPNGVFSPEAIQCLNGIAALHCG